MLLIFKKRKCKRGLSVRRRKRADANFIDEKKSRLKINTITRMSPVWYQTMLYNSNIHHRRSIRLKGYDYSQDGLYFITICIQDRKCLFGEITGASPAGAQMELNELGSIAYEQWQKLPERFTNIELDVFQIMPNHIHGIIVLTDVGAGFTPAPDDNTIADEKNAGVNPNQNNTNIPDHDDAVVNNDNAIANETWAGVNPAPTQNNTNIPDHDDAVVNNDNAIVYNDDSIAHYDNSITDEIRAGASPAPTGNSKSVGDIIGAYKSLVANECLKIFKQKWAEVNPAPYMGKLWQRNYYEHIIRDEQSYQRISGYIINNPVKWKDDKFYND